MHVVYWIYKSGHQRGPFTFSKIQSMCQSGIINGADQIRRADQQEWHTVGKVSRYLRSGREHSGSPIFAATMAVFVGIAFVWSFVMVWWMYS